MARELLVEGYLLFIKVLFSICKLFPLQNKVTFLTSFGDNCQFVYDEIVKEQLSMKKVILQKSGRLIDTKGDGQTIVLPFEQKKIAGMLRSIYHLATAKWVIVDNYFGELAVTHFKPEVKCVQLWHAVGAVKQFALRDPSVQTRSKRAKKRFLDVYKTFQYVVTGSETMAAIFKESFQIDNQQIVRTGVPRTDFFFDEEAKSKSLASFYKKYPDLEHKKIILYAPTFRDEELHTNKIALDLDILYHEIGQKDYAVVLKLHPAVTMKENFQQKYPGFVYQMNGEFHINELLLVTDLLITDYSSIPYEFSYLNRPMIFFAYDLKEYSKRRGFWEDYESSMPGPVVFSTEEIIKIINSGHFELEKVEPFHLKWNEYSNGKSSKQLIDVLFKDKRKKTPSQVEQPDSVAL